MTMVSTAPDAIDEIFISYAHVDNESPKKGLDGWITRFHHALEVRVAQVRGQKPKIFRDQIGRASCRERVYSSV